MTWATDVGRRSDPGFRRSLEQRRRVEITPESPPGPTGTSVRPVWRAGGEANATAHTLRPWGITSVPTASPINGCATVRMSGATSSPSFPDAVTNSFWKGSSIVDALRRVPRWLACRRSGRRPQFRSIYPMPSGARTACRTFPISSSCTHCLFNLWSASERRSRRLESRSTSAFGADRLTCPPSYPETRGPCDSND